MLDPGSQALILYWWPDEAAIVDRRRDAARPGVGNNTSSGMPAATAGRAPRHGRRPSRQLGFFKLGEEIESHLSLTIRIPDDFILPAGPQP